MEKSGKFRLTSLERNWILYDVGNSAFVLMVATLIPIFFNALAAYLSAGNQALVVYNGETSSSSGYSTNYARITSITITVTYLAATVWYRDGSTWKQCAVYYRLNGAWVQVVPYYNSGGSWIRV